MQHLSIRQLADTLGISHTDLRSRMAKLGIEGTPQGKGKPTLLSPDEQQALATDVRGSKAMNHQPLEMTVETVPISSGLAVFKPAPLATFTQDGELLRTQQRSDVFDGIEVLKGNMQALESARIAAAKERGRHQAFQEFVSQESARMQALADLEAEMAQRLGIAPKPQGNGQG